MDRWFYALVVVAMAVGFGRGALVGDAKVYTALENLGFTEIQVTDKAWFLVGMRGCSERDAAMFTATAVNPVGKRVTTTVCVGWPFKGATVRS
tara:strand:+ start:956 stop:1234 length:279 start_codon:yes stop_codon:yes gene_type:complete